MQQVEEIPLASISGLSGNRIKYNEINDKVVELTVEVIYGLTE